VSLDPDQLLAASPAERERALRSEAQERAREAWELANEASLAGSTAARVALALRWLPVQRTD